ncbi:KH domain-containing protein HEN4-like [Impatiens glandulifera]|uniref:KH domain-containing protein HEN4-like n=1 Tax=Impatiens glandulifera TaxID=253017 RepID=UPI001FB1505D|nr:KH domain-containing protein HEN4-like [Impatiens glandulifera]
MQDDGNDDRRLPRRRHRCGITRQGPKTLEPPFDFQPGQAWFRLLCHADTAGGVIGNCGTIVKRLESQIGARINLENTISGCNERVINVFGSGKIDRRVTVVEGNGGGPAEEVSQAQEALVRVFERILEVEGIKESVIRCRLLSGFMNIGNLMGIGGKTVQNIRKVTGAKIKVLPKDQLPQCASPSEELIQIFGDTLAVKKALLLVAYKLQDSDPQSSKFNNNNVSSPVKNSSPCFNKLNSLSDNVYCRSKVVFKLLCPAGKVGHIIGKSGTIIQALEKQTGASIRMSPPQPGCKERLATISAVENEKDHSPAQTALLRVFTSSIEEFDADKVWLSSGRKVGAVTASILVSSELVSCLTDNIWKVSSGISGVDIQVSEINRFLHCTEGDEKMVQITGEYEKVKRALFQVTCKLRQNHFANLHNSVDHRDPKMKEEKGNVNRSTINSNDDRSENARTVEVVVPNHAFDSIYGNLTRIKQISGAKIVLQISLSDEKEGMVVISGTSHEIQVAESLLQAFIQI